jgi:hypothetical protein
MLLQSGAVLAGPIALARIWPRSSHAAPIAAEPITPLSGTLAGWVVVEPDRGATARLFQLDAASRPIRQVAAADLPLAGSGASLQRVCQRAHEIALETVARSWDVPTAECIAGHGRIVHAARQHSVRYILWVDVAVSGAGRQDKG